MICFNSEAWFSAHAGKLDGKRVVLFGATGGIGRVLCRYILRCGGTLVTVDRNPDKAGEQMVALRREFPQASLERLTVDLEDWEAVDRICTVLETQGADVLIHNAGAYAIPRHRCSTGLDNVFQINFAAPYYITNRLLPVLAARQGRVIAVGSIAHRYAKTDPHDIDFSTRRQARLAYGNAKRYLMVALTERLRKEPAVKLAVTHPGITFTSITAHYPRVVFALIKHPMKWLFMPPEAAALSLLWGLFEETTGYEWIGPSRFDVWGKPVKKALTVGEEEERRRIAQTAETLYEEMVRYTACRPKTTEKTVV